MGRTQTGSAGSFPFVNGERQGVYLYGHDIGSIDGDDRHVVAFDVEAVSPINTHVDHSKAVGLPCGEEWRAHTHE